MGLIPMTRTIEDDELRRLIEVERLAEEVGRDAARDFALISRETGDHCANCGHFVGDHVLVQTCKDKTGCHCTEYVRRA